MIVDMSTDRKMTLGGAARVANTLSEGVELIDRDVTAIRVLIDHATAPARRGPAVSGSARDRAIRAVLGAAKVGGAILDTVEDAEMAVLAIEDAGLSIIVTAASQEPGTIPAPRVLVVGEDYRSGIGSSSAYAKADLVVDQTGRVHKWRYGPVPEVT
jgi:hypothetical protein